MTPDEPSEERGNGPASAGVVAVRLRKGGGPGRLTVQRWFLLVLALVAFLVLTAEAVTYILLSRTVDAADRLVDQLAPARTEAYRLQAAQLDQETGIRGYALTGDPALLDPYRRGVQAEARAAADLARLARGERAVASDLEQVRRTAAMWRSTYAEPAIAQVRRDGPKAVTASRVMEGKQIFDGLRALWTTQNRHLDDAVRAGHAQVRHDRLVRDVALTATLTGVLLIGVLLAVILHVAVGRPLSGLRLAVQRVADGEFDRPIAARGPADLRALAADVEAMRHRIVHELALSNDRERLLERRTADLDDQAVELRRSNSDLEQFAYVASHDLQEPLRKIASFCQLIQRRYQGTLDERGVQYIEFAVDGAKRMQVLINDLLTFSRVGRVFGESRPVELDKPLDQALTNLQGAIEDAGAQIERPGRLPAVIGDLTQLTMLWQNLIGNAVKFRAADRPPAITVGCQEAPDGWELSVADNGIGVSPEFGDKIFIIFQRLHTRDVYGGTGIGLALSKKIVEHHGGRIWLDAERDEGTCIRFVLPRPPGQDESATTDDPEGAGT